MTNFNFGKTAHDYARHRGGFPDGDLQALLAASFPEEPLHVPHRTFALVSTAEK